MGRVEESEAELPPGMSVERREGVLVLASTGTNLFSRVYLVAAVLCFFIFGDDLAALTRGQFLGFLPMIKGLSSVALFFMGFLLAKKRVEVRVSNDEIAVQSGSTFFSTIQRIEKKTATGVSVSEALEVVVDRGDKMPLTFGMGLAKEHCEAMAARLEKALR